MEFRDNIKAHILKDDGHYEKQDRRGKSALNSQMLFCREARERVEAMAKQHEKTRVFIPAEPEHLEEDGE